MRILSTFATLLLAAPLTASLAQEGKAPAPEMQAFRLSAAPVVDGAVLNDKAWAGGVPASGFWQIKPDDGRPSSQRTDVYVGYTETALYVGVVAYDDDPASIVTTDTRRDSDLGDADAFLIIIDGLLDRQNGYVFGTNTAGMEYDAQVTSEGSGDALGFGGGFNLNWDGSWTVSSRIHDDGWSAEFEIPFRTLRYGPARTQDWGINFQRNIRRKNEVAFWAPLERNRGLERVSDAGTLRNIAPPSQRNLKITPYVLARTQRGGSLSAREDDSEFGFDIKYSVTPSLTLDLTYNTDFAQVEADEQQLNLDRFNLFFPEKRPFFLENAGQFAVGNPSNIELFFSRKIGISDDGAIIPVEGGARLSGKVGKSTNIGLLYMSTDAVEGVAPGNTFSVARVNHELPNRSSIGAIYVGRDGDGTHLAPKADDNNRTYGLDGRWGIGDHILLKAWLAKTATPGRENGRDDAYSLDAGYSSEKWSGTLAYTQVGEDFNPEVGFLFRSEYRSAYAALLRRVRPRDLWGLMELRPHASYRGYWKFDGFQESGFLHIDNHWEFRTGAELHTGINFTREGVVEAFEIVPGVKVPAGTYDHNEVQLNYFGDESKPLNFSLQTKFGGSFGGDRNWISPAIRYRFGETFSSELSFSHNDFDLPGGSFKANLAYLRLSYSFTPKVLLQALVQYNDVNEKLGTNVRFSWLRSASTGLFLVYNEVDERGIGRLPTGREFILKYSHIFDVFD